MLDEVRDRQCDRGRLNISSVDSLGHDFTPCILPRGHADDHAMAPCMHELHAAQGSDLGPWQTAAEARDLANEIRDRCGDPRVDYDGKISPDVEKLLFEHDGETRPGEAVPVGKANSIDEAMAMLHGIGKN